MSKKYFAPEIDEEFCHGLSTIKEMMRNEGLYETEVFEAKMATDVDYFYCTFYHEIGEVGELCGELCDAYSPRNGKSGRCRHSGHCYERTDIKRNIKIKNNL